MLDGKRVKIQKSVCIRSQINVGFVAGLELGLSSPSPVPAHDQLHPHGICEALDSPQGPMVAEPRRLRRRRIVLGFGLTGRDNLRAHA
jgi:hypothetical protein